MIGAIAGDIIGSVYEGAPAPGKDFPLFIPASRFTDDTVLTIAVAQAILDGEDYGSSLRKWGRRYPNAGYGGWFRHWLQAEDAPAYHSFGNGSAMRVAAVGWAFDDLERVLREAAKSAEVTHNHPEGIKGAQAVAGSILLGRTGTGKQEIARFLSGQFGYDCDVSLAELRERGGFDVTCQGTIPAAAAAFLESVDFEDTVRNAISLGGDADTNACIAGAIAEAHYGSIPESLQRETLQRLTSALRSPLLRFAENYSLPLVEKPEEGRGG